MLCGLMLLLTCNNIKPQKLDSIIQDVEIIKTKAYFGYLESQNGALVFIHMPDGKNPNTIVYYHQLVFQKQDQKILAEKAKNADTAVKIVGKIASINGNQFIIVDTIRILDYEKN